MLDKTLNGDGYTPTGGESAFTHQLAIASVLRSTSARRPNTGSSASLPQSSSAVPTPEQKPSPGVLLPSAARDGDSLPRKSDVKSEPQVHITAKSEPKIEVGIEVRTDVKPDIPQE